MLLVLSKGKGLAYWQELYVGKEFSVDRRTGTMVGALKNAYVTKPVVIDFGSDTNSFKVVTTMKKDQGAGAGSNVYVLIVKEFASSRQKPFTFLDNTDLFFGTCVYF